MKNIISVSILLLTFYTVSSAQIQPGRVRYLVVSNWTRQLSGVDYISKQSRERMQYMYGNRSEWKQYSELFFDENRSFYRDSEEKAEPDDEGYAWRKDVYAIRRDFAAGRMLDEFQQYGQVLRIEDTLATPAWKILNDMKEVAGHVCMNAFLEDTLRRQRITAWFALDIPVQAGPERFYGLPGLILEVDINEGAKVVTADKIEVMPVADLLAPPKKTKGKKMTEAEYRRQLQENIQIKKKSEEVWFWGMRY